jgi:hypothetical protein
MEKTLERIGFGFASAAFVAALGFDIAQILQIIGVLGSPWDEILIYGFSLLIATPFLLSLLALHHITPENKRFWTHAAVIFGVMYVLFVSSNYVVQLTAVLPYANPNPVLVQTPHSLFWTFDALGYITLGLATVFAVPAFGRKGIEPWVRRFFLANGLVTPLITFVYFYPDFSTTLLLLGFPWIITATGSVGLLALFFKRRIGEQEE